MQRRYNADSMYVDKRRDQWERRQDPVSSVLGPSGIGVLPGDDPESATGNSEDPPDASTTFRTRTQTVTSPIPTLTFPITSTPGRPGTTSSSSEPSTSSNSNTDVKSQQTKSSSTLPSTSKPSFPTQQSPSTVPSNAETSSPLGRTGQSTSNPNATQAAAVQGNSTDAQHEIVTTFTSVSGSETATITSTIRPAGSLVPAPDKGTFFANKTQAGVVLTFVILIGLGLFAFLGYRFYKTVKRLQTERETEDLARSTRYRTRIDDAEDDDAHYGGRMAQVDATLPASNSFVFLRGQPNARPSEDLNSSISVRRRVSSLDRLDTTVLTSFGSTVQEYPSTRSNRDSCGDMSMHSKRSNTVGGHSATGTLQTSGGVQRSPTATSSKSLNNYLSTGPFPPPITLPDFFGDDRPTTSVSKPLEDDEDYQRTIPRVLKIANE